jgi:hypothetical protein
LGPSLAPKGIVPILLDRTLIQLVLRFICMKVFPGAPYLLPCLALMLAAAPMAHAQYSISGEVWEGGTTSNVPALGSAIYGEGPTAIFTVTNSVSPTDLLNFYSSDDGALTSFLTTAAGGGSNSDTLTYLSGAGAGADGINNDLFQFQGTTTLANGSYNFEHDDGLILYLTGNGVINDAVINAGGPTAAEATAFTVCASGCDATAGTYTFTLDYAEVDGPPAELLAALPLTGPAPSVTPEPTSLTLMGTGVLALAGMIRRRFVA